MLAGRHVLVVEDELLVLMNIEAILSELGCTAISVAATVDAALALLESAEPFDIAILDVNLGAEPSYAVADALALRAIPFVFATGYGRRGVDARFEGCPVLNKPYSDGQLHDVIGLLLNDLPGTTPLLNGQD